MHRWYGVCEAGCREEAGRVMEPRHGYRCGQEESLAGQREGKADAFHAAEGSSPGHAKARVEDTTEV